MSRRTRHALGLMILIAWTVTAVTLPSDPDSSWQVHVGACIALTLVFIAYAIWEWRANEKRSW